MSKVVNIDEFITEKEMVFVVGGKEYRVKDIPLGIDKFVDENGINGIKSAVAKMFGCSEEDLAGLGQGACLKIWEEVNKNFLPIPDSASNQ